MTTTLAKRSLSLALAVILSCMALPSLVKLAHAIYEHQERECSTDSRVHFHTAEFDCSFQKFKNTTPLFFKIAAWNFKVPRLYTTHRFLPYSYLSQFEGLSFSLRGPPVFS